MVARGIQVLGKLEPDAPLDPADSGEVEVWGKAALK